MDQSVFKFITAFILNMAEAAVKQQKVLLWDQVGSRGAQSR